jgi:pyruvate dehydrogenase E1 component beta subunit
MISLSVREALNEAMAEEMRRDDDVFLLGEEVGEYDGAYKVSQGLLKEFGPRRVMDTPITEAGFAGVGVGAAFMGLKPIVEFMTFNFALQAMDHLINSAAKTRYMSGGRISCPIVFRGPNGSASRVAAQHSQDFSSWFAQVPGLKVLAPHSATDAKGLLKAAIRDPDPVVFLENEMLYGKKFEIADSNPELQPIGVAKIVRSGSDATIICFSRGVEWSLEAAEELGKTGISCEIIDLRTLRPLDMETIFVSVKKTNRLLIVDESWPSMGVASEIAFRVMDRTFDYLDAPIKRVTSEEVPLPYASNLEEMALPNAKKIIVAIEGMR